MIFDRFLKRRRNKISVGQSDNSGNTTAVTYQDFPPVNPEDFQRTLEQSDNSRVITIYSSSVHCQGGHCGVDTYYYPEENKVVFTSWGFGFENSQPEVLDIPPSIQSEDEVRAYVIRMKPLWMGVVSS